MYPVCQTTAYLLLSCTAGLILFSEVSIEVIPHYNQSTGAAEVRFSFFDLF